MQPSRNTPSGGWYVLAAALALAGVAWFVVAVARAERTLDDFAASLQRVTVPGGGVVQLDDQGPYTIFYEHRTVLDGEVVERELRPQWAGCTVTPADAPPDAGDSLAVQPAGRVEAYGTDPDARRSGYAVWRVEPPTPGRYVLDAQMVGGADAQTPLVLAIGRVSITGLLAEPWGVFGGATAMAFGVLVGGGLAVATWYRRSGADRLVAARRPGGPPAPDSASPAATPGER